MRVGSCKGLPPYARTIAAQLHFCPRAGRRTPDIGRWQRRATRPRDAAQPLLLRSTVQRTVASGTSGSHTVANGLGSEDFASGTPRGRIAAVPDLRNLKPRNQALFRNCHLHPPKPELHGHRFTRQKIGSISSVYSLGFQMVNRQLGKTRQTVWSTTKRDNTICARIALIRGQSKRPCLSRGIIITPEFFSRSTDCGSTNLRSCVIRTLSCRLASASTSSSLLVRMAGESCTALAPAPCMN